MGKILVTLLINIAFQSNLWAQSAIDVSKYFKSGGAGNGGDVIVCKEFLDSEKIPGKIYFKPGTYSLDFVVTHPDGNTDLDAEITDWDSSVARITKNLDRVFPEWITKLQRFSELIYSENILKSQVWRKSDLDLVDLKDENLLNILPVNCLEVNGNAAKPQIHQAIIHRPHVEKHDVMEFLYNHSLVKKLESSPRQYSYLMNHEFLRTVGAADSDDIRMVNALLHSRQFDHITRSEFLHHLFLRNIISKVQFEKQVRKMESELKQLGELFIQYSDQEKPLESLQSFISVSGLNPNEARLTFRSSGKISSHSPELNLLHIAAYLGRIDIIRTLVNREGFDLALQTTSGETAMHFAIANNQIKTIKYLVSLGAREEEVSTKSWHLVLLMISKNNNVPAFRLAFSRKYLKPEEEHPILTAFLVQAALSGNFEVSREFVNQMTNPINFAIVSPEHKFYSPTYKGVFKGMYFETQTVLATDSLFASAMSGNMELFKYLVEHPSSQLAIDDMRFKVKFRGRNWDGIGYYSRIDRKTLRAVIEEIVEQNPTDNSPQYQNLKAALQFLQRRSAKSDLVRGEESEDR